MKLTGALIIMTTAILAACSGNSPKDPQADPGALAEAIFEAAKTGNYEGLAALIDADADNDSKMIAQVAGDPTLQEEFKKYFSGAKLAGEPMISGEKASVSILFGPNGEKEETFEMVKREGKWFLQSF
jgi:hypothetical protein